MVVSALLVAFTPQPPVVAGAVNVTGFVVVLDSVPHVALQVTAVLVVLLTVAIKPCVPLVSTLAVAGATEIATGAVTVTFAIAVLVVSALLVAVTVQLSLVDGAVYVTGLAVVLDSEPQLALHFTAVFVVCPTVAVKV